MNDKPQNQNARPKTLPDRIATVYEDGVVVFYLNGGIVLEVSKDITENAVKIKALSRARLAIRPNAANVIFVTGE